MLKLGADFRGRFSSSSYCLVEECFKNKLNVQHSVVDSLKKNDYYYSGGGDQMYPEGFNAIPIFCLTSQHQACQAVSAQVPPT